MKLKWLVADVTAVGSPDRAECAILGVILAGRCFGQFRPFLCHLMKTEWLVTNVTVVGSPDRAERAILGTSS